MIKMQEIITRIETMSDKELSTILMYRYIQDYTFKEISQRMYQSETTIRRKYKETLNQINKQAEMAEITYCVLEKV